MPRPRNAVPAYLLHKPSGQARVRIAGKDYYLGPYLSEQSRQKYAALIQQHFAGALVSDPVQPETPQAGISIAEMTLVYLQFADAFYVKGGGPTKEPGLIRMAVRPLVRLFGASPAVDFGPLALKAVREEMIAAGWVRKTVNESVNRIRRMFKHGVENELVPADALLRLQAVAPLKAGKSAAPDRPKRRAVPQDQIDAVRALVRPMVADLIDLQLLCGARPGELLGLTPEMIERKGEIWVADLEHHKTEHHGHSRVLYFGPRCQTILAKYIGRKKSGLLFAMQRVSYTRAIVRACEQAFGMPDKLRKPPKTATPEQLDKIRQQASEWRLKYCWSPHWLRHTAGKRLREEFGLETTQAVLGHATADMSERYAGLARERAIEAAKKIG